MTKLNAAPGHWIQPGTDSRTIGRQIVGNAYREYLAADTTGSTDAIDAAYHAKQERLQNAWRDDAQAQRNKARQEFIDKRSGTTDSIEDAYQAAQERKQNAWKEDAQAVRDSARADFLARRHGGDK